MEQCQETYNFRQGEVKVAERRDEFLEGEFTTMANPKDSYCLNDLRNSEAKLIFHLEKPKRIISKWAATFLGAMWKKITVDSAELVKEMVDRMVKGLQKLKKSGTPLPS